MNQLFRYLVEASDAGRRVDEFLASRLTGLSRMRIANLLSDGACLVNNQRGRAGHHLLAGDVIEIGVAEGPPTSMTPESIPLEISYEDEHLVVVVKPAGMLVHPTLGVKGGTLANALVYHLNRFQIEDCGSWIDESNPQSEIPNPESAIQNPQSIIRPGIVHRLDRATSGLMVIAKTQRALSTLSRHFHLRRVEKRYVAVVSGLFDADVGTIQAPIGRDPDRQPRWWVMENGKPAETRFLVRERSLDSTFVELQPVTGRTNQLRIHCAYLGHPIIGDEVYSDCASQLAGRGRSHSAAALVSRLYLHAYRLAFHHPANGQWMEFESGVPEEMTKWVELKSVTC